MPTSESCIKRKLLFYTQQALKAWLMSYLVLPICCELYLWLKLLLVKTAECNKFSHFVINALSLKKNNANIGA